MNNEVNENNNGVINPVNGIDTLNGVNIPNSGGMIPESAPVNPDVNPEKSKNKGKGKLILSLLVILVIVAGGVFFYYKNYMLDPVNVYQNAINDFYTLLSGGIDRAKEAQTDFKFKVNPLEEPLTFNMGAKFSTNIDVIKEFSGYQYDLSMGVDYKNKKASLKGSIDQNGKKLIDVLVAILNDKAYLQSKQVIDKVLSLGDISFFEELELDEAEISNALEEVFGESAEKFSLDDVKTILNELKNIVIKSIDKKKMTTSNESIVIDGKEYKLKKVTYDLDYENQLRTAKFILNSIANNDILLDKLSSVSNMEKDKLKENIKASVDKVDIPTDTHEVIALYVDKDSKIMAAEVYSKNELVMKVTNGDSLIFDFLEGNKIIVKKEAEYTNLKVVAQDAEMIELKLYNVENAFKMDYKINIPNFFDVGGTLEIKNTVVNETKISSDLSFSIEIDIKGKKQNLAVDLSFGFEKGNIDTLDTTGSIPLNELSPEEVKQMQDALGSILRGTPFYDFIGELLEGPVDHCDDAYDCVCDGDICDCKYLDENYEQQQIYCENYGN